jgi:hypothetical protein
MNLTPEKSASILGFWMRVVAFSMFFALVAVVMPTSWLVASVKMLIPEAEVTILTQYLSRCLSMFYFMVGGLLWIFGGNVKKYATCIRLTAYCYLLPCTIGLICMVIGKFTGSIQSSIFSNCILIDLSCGIAMAFSVIFLLSKAKITKTETTQ